MTVKYNAIPMVFDRFKWAAALAKQPDVALVAAQELSGVSASGWWHWLNPGKSKLYEYPLMGSFVNVCNLLDLDPREFFALDERFINHAGH